MSTLILLTLIGYCFAQNYEYSAEQKNATLIVLPNNSYVKLYSNDSRNVTGIEYLQSIVPETLLMIRVIFGDANGPLDPQNAENTRLNVCEILDRDLDNPESSQRKYHMASALGLKGHRCPIAKGIMPIVPYMFPRKFTTKNLGHGDRYFAMIMEVVEKEIENIPILELRVHMKLNQSETYQTQTNQTERMYDESASPVAVSLSTAVVGIVIVLQLSKYIK